MQSPEATHLRKTAEEELADIGQVRFTFEDFVKYELKLNIDSRKLTGAAAITCRQWLRGQCKLGDACPNKHQNDKTVVCKHWLRGLCKKGEDCEFLHEFNLKKMPECWFYSKFGECSNPECMYLHIDANSKIKECAYYNRGFCRLGPNCKSRHVRRAVCQLYLTGFCPHGKECTLGHPHYDSVDIDNIKLNVSTGSDVTCYQCGQRGHVISRCPRRDAPLATPIPQALVG